MRFFDEDLSQPKVFFEGTHRACSPAETLNWLLPKARAIGVTRVGRLTGLDVVDVPVWFAVRPNARGLATSQGKGLSDEAAKASAVMESVENWHAEMIDCPVRICDYQTIRREGEAVDPDTLNYYQDSPPRADLAIAWMETFDLVRGAPCWAPYECISTDYVVKADGALRSTFVQSSNGLAGGNHVLEAMVHGLLEMVERHAIACDMPGIRSFDPSIRVDPATIEDAACESVLRQLDAAGMRVAIFCLPSSFGIPVFACSILEVDEGKRWRALPPFNGYGCHPEPRVALLRALTEAVQSRVTYIAGSREDISLSDYTRSANPDDLKSYHALFARPADGVFTPTKEERGSFEEEIRYLAGVLAAQGYDRVLIADLRKRDLKVPVVKALVPGLGTPEALIRGRPVRVPPKPKGQTSL